MTDTVNVLPYPEIGAELDECPTCQFPGYVHTRDQRGLLIRHPGRAWPCRVPNEETKP